MSRSPLTRCLIMACAGTLLSSGIVAQLCGEETPLPATETQALADRLVDWKKSFHNFRVVTRWNNPGQWIHRRPKLAAPGALDGYYHTEDWLYSDDGRSRFEAIIYENGLQVSRSISGNDHKRLFSCNYRDRMDVPDSIHINLIPTNYQPNRSWGHPVASLHINGTRWIGENLRNSPIEVVRYEEDDGAWCAVAVRPSDFTELFFDLEHDGLIKREINAATGYDRIVDEFRQLNHGRWFPVRGRTLTSNNDTPYEWEVLEAEVNLELTDADFAPPAPGPFTVISDVTAGAAAMPGASAPVPQRQASGIHHYWLWGAGALLVGLLIAIGYRSQSSTWLREKIADTEEPTPLPKTVALFAPWTWPRWNRWLLVGTPTLLIVYVLSIGPVLLINQFSGGWSMPAANRLYYPLLAVNEELPSSSQGVLDRYCRTWSSLQWTFMQRDHRTLKLELRMHAGKLNAASIALAALLATGLVIYFWRRRSFSQRHPSTN